VEGGGAAYWLMGKLMVVGEPIAVEKHVGAALLLGRKSPLGKWGALLK